MKICTLPGLNGSGPEHWQTRWERKHGLARIEQQEWAHPVFEIWQERLCRLLEPDREYILVAHSLGCLLAVKALDRIRPRVRGLFLVAPPDQKSAVFPRELQSFSGLPTEPLKVPGRLVYSEDDPYATAEFAEGCARLWGLKPVSVGRRGHINSLSGLGDWEEGYALFREFVGQAAPELRLPN